MKNEEVIKLYISRLYYNNVCNLKSYSNLENRWYGAKSSKKMMKYIKENKGYRFYVYKAEQKESMTSKSPNSIKCYLCYYVSLVVDDNFYYFLILQKSSQW